MPELDVSQVSIGISLLGCYLSISGLVSYIIKEKLYLSEALLAMVYGIIVGPFVLNWFNPSKWSTDVEQQQLVTFELTRIVIGVQVLFCGISLPKAYLKREFVSLVVLLGPVMIAAWMTSSLLIWAVFEKLTFLEALAIGSCVTPTDPVLANSITQGRYAAKHVPLHVRHIISAESGANDGLGYPFLYLALYLILYPNPDFTSVNTVGEAIGRWAYDIVVYQIILATVMGLVIGYVARRALKVCKKNLWADHVSFLGYGIGLTLGTLGITGIIGSDDLLCCFIVGNSFTWDDYYRLETEDDSFQEVIDFLLNTAIFFYIGAILPWSDFTNPELGFAPWKFVLLGIAILLLRRLPWVAAMTFMTPVFGTYRESIFAGWFGPIGVSAIFYVQVALRVLPDDEACHRLRAAITPIVYFIIFCSIVVHGITIPFSKTFVRVRSLTRSGTMQSNLVARLPWAPTELPRNEDVRRSATTPSTPVGTPPGSPLPMKGARRLTEVDVTDSEVVDTQLEEVVSTSPHGSPGSTIEAPAHGGTPGRVMFADAKLRRDEVAYEEGEDTVVIEGQYTGRVRTYVTKQAYEAANDNIPGRR